MRIQFNMVAKCLILLLLFAACRKDSNNNSSPDYYPNKAGDSWTYDVTDSAQTTPGNPYTPEHYSVTVRITGTIKLADGIEAAIWQYEFPWGNDTNYVRKTGDTIKVFQNAYSKTIEYLQFPGTIFIQPFSVNERWDGKLYGVDSSRVVGLQTINNATLSFENCYNIYTHYIGPNIEYSDHYYIKPSVGIVKKEFIHYNNGPILYQTWILKTFIVH